jgi:hypothetical protein
MRTRINNQEPVLIASSRNYRHFPDKVLVNSSNNLQEPSARPYKGRIDEQTIRMFVDIRNQTIDPFGDTMDAKLFYQLLMPKLDFIAKKLKTTNIGACVLCNYELYTRGMGLSNRLALNDDIPFVVSIFDMLEILLSGVGVDISSFVDITGDFEKRLLQCRRRYSSEFIYAEAI